MMDETEAIRQRYLRRKGLDPGRYSELSSAVLMSRQETTRAITHWIRKTPISAVEDKTVLEIGCGFGGNLLRLILLGFRPENLIGNELLEERAAVARHVLPSATRIVIGDARLLELERESFDVVYQSRVFTSVLDQTYQQELADRVWALVRPGGGVLWYDFVYDNPSNPDVRGVPLRRIRQLFPEAAIASWRVTLAPPIARLVVRLSYRLYDVFNLLPILRTHRLCWIQKSPL